MTTRQTKRRLGVVSILVSIAAFSSACAGSSAPTAGPQGPGTPATASAPPAEGGVVEGGVVEGGAPEDGVPILTSDAGILGEPTIVYAHFDGPDDAVWRLLARSDNPDVPVVNVEIQPSSTFDSTTANIELLDGPPALVEEFDSGMTRVTFAGAQGQWVQVSSFELDKLSLIGVASFLDVSGDTLVVVVNDWLIVGNIELPLYENGYQTLFDAPEIPGVQVEILSSRLTGDLELWYEWTAAERVEDPRFEWAFRQRNEAVGVDRFVALWDNGVVVEINNVESDDVLADIIDGLREMQPGESEIVPDTPEADVAS